MVAYLPPSPSTNVPINLNTSCVHLVLHCGSYEESEYDKEEERNNQLVSWRIAFCTNYEYPPHNAFTSRERYDERLRTEAPCLDIALLAGRSIRIRIAQDGVLTYAQLPVQAPLFRAS